MKLILNKCFGIIGNVKILCEDAVVRVTYDNGNTFREDEYRNYEIKYSINVDGQYVIETDDTPLFDTHLIRMKNN